MRQSIRNANYDWDVIVDNLHESIVTTDAEGYITNWNKGSQRLFGYTAEEAIGQHAETCYERSREAIQWEIIEPLLRDGYLDICAKMVRKSGETFDGHLLASLITAPDGTVTGLVGNILDISERKRSEAKLKASEARLADAQKIAGLGNWDYDPETGEVWWSDENYRLMGFEPGEVTPDFDLVLAMTHPDDRRRVRDATDAAVASKTSYDVEHRMYRNDGALISVHERGEVVSDGGGNVIRMNGTVQDITGRKRADADLRKSEFLLSEAQELSHLGNWELDLDNSFLYWSDETYRLLGAEPGSFQPTVDKFLELVHPDDRMKAKAEIDKTLVQAIPMSYEHRVVRPDGTERILIERGRVVRNEQGQVMRLFGTMQDVTETRLAQGALQESHDRLEQTVVQRTQELAAQTELLRRAEKSAHVAHFHRPLAGGQVYWSDELYRMFGVDKETFVPTMESALSFLHVDDAERYLGILKAASAHGGSYQIEVRIVRPDGAIRHIQAELETELSRAGDPIDIFGVLKDVTEAREAEAEILSREAELSTITRLSPTGIFRTDQKGKPTFVNDRWYEIMAFPSDWDATLAWYKSIHPDDCDVAIRNWCDCVAQSIPYMTEFRVITPDRSVGWVYSEATPELGPNGELVGYVGFTLDITERKAAEEAAAQERQRTEEAGRLLDDAVESFDGGFALYDADDRFVFCNSSYRNVFSVIDNYLQPGVAFEDLIRAMYDNEELVPAKYSNEIVIQKRLAVHRNPESGPAVVETTDGRWLMAHEYRTHDGGTALLRTDITERINAERALAESEERFSLAMRGANDGLWDWDLETNRVYRSPRYLEMLGYKDDEFPVTKEGGDRLVHPEDHQQVDEFWSRIKEGKEASYEVEVRMRHKDGHFVDILTRAFAVRGADGNPTRFVGTNTDISERKQAESQLLAAKTLAESGERIRSAFENVTIGNVVISNKGIIEVFNPTASKIFGYTAEEAIGQNVKMLMPGGDLRNYLETGDAKITGIGREVTGLRKNGEEFPMHLGVGKMVVGEKVSFIGSITDLTEMKHLEEQVRRSQRLEAVGQLTGGVAHDFNNLLAIMIGNAELLEEMVDDDEGLRKRTGAIIGAVERGSSLTQRLLAFSRQQTLSPVAKDVAELIDGLEDMLKRTLGETIDLRVADMPDLWPATIDPHQFENALVNLAINARDAMPEGGALTIEAANVTLDRIFVASLDEVMPGDYVKVAVSDTGSGIPQEVLEKVFEPFFTTKEVGQGSGLGLSMVYGFVKQSGGHITIYSEVGIGTTIKVYLPRSAAAAGRDDTEITARELARGSERILIVEDDPDVRNIAVSLLHSQGYEVVEAQDGLEAVAHLTDDGAFDLLFTDVVLPGGMNGVEIAEQAKRLQPDIKVIYTTGYAENAFVNTGQLDPGLTVVNKPYRRAELLGKVRARLESDQV